MIWIFWLLCRTIYRRRCSGAGQSIRISPVLAFPKMCCRGESVILTDEQHKECGVRCEEGDLARIFAEQAEHA